MGSVELGLLDAVTLDAFGTLVELQDPVPSLQAAFSIDAEAAARGLDAEVAPFAALERIWQHVRALNALVEQRKPWELAKDDARAGELDRTLYELADGLRLVAVALAAYLPETAPRILEALGQSGDLAWENVASGRTVPAQGIGPAEPLFPRVDPPAVAA